jgi:hypothetical protein
VVDLLGHLALLVEPLRPSVISPEISCTTPLRVHDGVARYGHCCRYRDHDRHRHGRRGGNQEEPAI